MGKLPGEIRLTNHAQLRLEERKNDNMIYNTKNLIRSSCKWYNRDDLIVDSGLFLHSLYVCRKSNQLGYITDGNIEVIYNKGTGLAVTILEVKDKFKPITKYIKPEALAKIEAKKELKKMRKKISEQGICPDCGKEGMEITSQGICVRCRTRKTNAKARDKEYIPYIDLNEEEKARIDRFQEQNTKIGQKKTEKIKQQKELNEVMKAEVKVVENYYQAKAEQAPVTAQIVEKKDTPVSPSTVINPLEDSASFINTLRNCGCEIPQDTLKEVLDVLVATDKLKDVFMTIAKSESQDAILNLEQALNVVERKLQHDWEFNGFQEADDIRFKGFLTWRRVLKGAIYFWKKLYQTNALIEIQRAWNAYTQDPNDKILLAGDRINTAQKRYQITTDSISTIFNTRKPFTRVFYATSKENAYKDFVKWMADRQLHEDKSKTTIVELSSEGEDGRK